LFANYSTTTAPPLPPKKNTVKEKKYTATQGVILNSIQTQACKSEKKRNEPYKLLSSSLDSLKMGARLSLLHGWRCRETKKWISGKSGGRAHREGSRATGGCACPSGKHAAGPDRKPCLSAGSLAAAPAGKLRHPSRLARIAAAPHRLPHRS
jgi:hypothetical protein